jgi:DNA-binding SARP family transcriptional activator
MRLELLGPARIWGQDRMLVLGPPKQRAVLGLLASRVNEVVGMTEIVDAVWGSAVPQSAVNGVHTYVAGLRRVLEPDREPRESGGILASAGGGYTLNVAPETIDIHQFARRYRQAKRLHEQGETHEAAQLYESALSLWHGDAFANIPGPFAEMERTRLHELRLTTIEEWAVSMLAVGHGADIVSTLSGLVLREPLRERLRWLLMLALYRCGRRAHALGLYREGHRLFREELGIEPGPELRKLHDEILAGDPAALASRSAAEGPLGGHGVVLARADAAADRAPRPAQLPPCARGFVGRADELARLRAAALERRPPQAPVAVVIEGEAGIGKSALALHLAHQIAKRYPDGQLVIDLCGTNPDRTALTPATALAQLLHSLGVDDARLPADVADRTALYRSLLDGKHMLIVLDDALNAAQVRPLIPRGPACVVVTSRHNQTELAVRDGALRLPLGPLQPGDVTDLLAYLVGAERVVGQHDALARLGRLCGYRPLALRIAAATLAAKPRLPVAEFIEKYAAQLARLRAPRRIDAPAPAETPAKSFATAA